MVGFLTGLTLCSRGTFASAPRQVVVATEHPEGAVSIFDGRTGGLEKRLGRGARCASVDVPLHPVVPRAVDLTQGAVGVR